MKVDLWLKMNNSSDGSSNEYCSSRLCSQGVSPKVKGFICNKESEVCADLQNGTASHTEEFNNTQNGASCSFLVSLSSSSVEPLPSTSCLNPGSGDKQNGECSGEKCSAKGRSLSSEENDSRNHDKKRKTGCFIDSESSSGNENEEGLSGDDYCIYTYKGDQFADLPNSFFPADMVVNGGHQALRENHRKVNYRRETEDRDRNNLGSSPEMDYLEMDFDPGPSLEQDSEEDLSSFERKPNDSPVQGLLSDVLMSYKNDEEVHKLTVETDSFQDNGEFQPGPSNKPVLQGPLKRQTEDSDCNSNSFNRTKGLLSNCCSGFCEVNETGQNCCVTTKEGNEEKLEGGVSAVNSKSCPIMVGERLINKVLSINESDLGTSASNKIELDSRVSFDGIMLWSEQEAVSKQMILMSSEVSCAATAVINALLVLKMRVSIEKVKQGISSKLKSESTPIPQYLVSRSYAGVSHENLIRGIHHASHGLLYARFFQMYPRRDVALAEWLVQWMKKGAVPIATMNVQRESVAEDSALDVRHHQMIFGVNGKGIYLTNPLECLQEEELWSRLVSPSVLKIKRSEIVARWTPDSNLKPLMFQTDVRWKEMNVLGQVVNIIRESSDAGAQGKFQTQHILIPGSSGITLVIPRHSPAYEELASTVDLPLLTHFKSE